MNKIIQNKEPEQQLVQKMVLQFKNRNKIFNYKLLKLYIESKGGKLLSNEYINTSTKIEIRCENNHHSWWVNPSHLRQGTWCPYCTKKKIKNQLQNQLQNMINFAQTKEAKCISTQYINSGSKLEFICKEGHSFQMTLSHVKEGHWCPICSGIKLINPLEEAKLIAKEHNGKCNSTKYINAKTNLEWECEFGHQWNAVLRSVRKGHWCPFCDGQRLINPLKELQQIINDKGGKCLSNQYINDSTKIQIECKEEHIFNKDANHIKRGEWCPYCNNNKAEEICRSIFELAFQSKFLRSKIILNPFKQGKLELDGYNKELQIAFEYNGIQHYKERVKNWNVNLAYRKQLDEYKIKWCQSNGIILVVIPYTVNSTPEALYQFILEEYFKITNKQFPIIEPKQIDINTIYNHSYLEELQEYIEKKNGKLISERYINNVTKIIVECKFGHRWLVQPSNIKSGKWCPQCANKNTKNIIKI